MKLLYLTDSMADTELANTCISREIPGCILVHVRDDDLLLETLAKGGYQGLLVGDELPTRDGLVVLDLVRKHAPEISVIMMGGDVGEERAAEFIRRGAANYVHKSRLQHLISAIRQLQSRMYSNEHSPPQDMALQQAEARIREQAALLDKAQDAIIVQNMQGTVTYWNKGAESIYGWSSAEAVGQDIVRLLSLEVVRHRFAREHTLGQGEWRGELRHKAKSGKEVIVQSRWSLVRERDGPPEAFLVINTDVTDNRILESKFLRAQRLESMGMLVGGIAHDLNNVLAPILMSVDLLRGMVDTPEADMLVRTMQRSVKHGSALVQQLLAFARGAEGRHLELELIPLLTEFVEFMRETLTGDIKLDLIFKRSPPPVMADATQLKQVLMNLCINARDAMSSGGCITITIDEAEIAEAQAHLLPESQPGRYVVMSVTDTGSGIPSAILERIFDPFFTTKETGRGTGLGLSTVRGIVKGHGGFLTVESDAGRGTTFRIYLPVHSSPVAANSPAILIVDDEEMVCTALTLLLKSAGYHVLSAANGEMALQLLASPEQTIVLLITDLRLPVMDGTQLITAAREIHPQLPVIALTGTPQFGQDSLPGFPGIRLLAKPMTRPALVKAVEEALSTVGV
jgi:two-component system, cell cycle sensor histidine kinase and response regulator CckA